MICPPRGISWPSQLKKTSSGARLRTWPSQLHAAQPTARSAAPLIAQGAGSLLAEIHFDNQPSRFGAAITSARTRLCKPGRAFLRSAQRSGTKRCRQSCWVLCSARRFRDARYRRSGRPSPASSECDGTPTRDSYDVSSDCSHRRAQVRPLQAQNRAAEIPIPELKREPDRQGPGKNSNRPKPCGSNYGDGLNGSLLGLTSVRTASSSNRCRTGKKHISLSAQPQSKCSRRSSKATICSSNLLIHRFYVPKGNSM